MVVMTSEEEISGSSKEAEEGAIVSMPKQCSNKGGSVLLQRKHNLSVTFHRNFQGVMLKLFQAPEITSNFGAFPPSSRSQFKFCLEEVAESTSSPTIFQKKESTSSPSKKDSVKMIGWNNSETTQRSQISKTLREVIKRAVMEFRLSSSALNVDERENLNDVVEAVPVSFRPPESVNMDMVFSQRKRVTTLLVGESLVSFKLPRSCNFDQKDLDELVEAERRANGENININNAPKYSLVERLEGWKMERRQRVNGRFDMYYHHLRSRRTFRSITEVVNFFLFEVYPDKPLKSATKSKIGEDDHVSGEKSKRRERRKRKLIDEGKKSREEMHPIYDLDGEDHDHHIPIYDLDGEDEKADDHQKPTNDVDDEDHHSPIHDDDNAYDQKETVEKFLAEAYNNLINGHQDRKFSIDINEEIGEEEEEDGNFKPNNQTVEELLAEAYNNLLNYSNNEPKFQKAKEKRSSRSIEKPRRKKAKTFIPISFPSFPNPPINLNSIPIEKEREKEKITDTVVEQQPSMKVEEKASVIASVKHKRFNIKEVNGNLVFSDVDCEPNYASMTTAGAGGGGGSSAIEVAKSVAFSHMDECDLINHIPESSDMFDLAVFLANNRGSGGF
ncbi:uncharacterized protein LOC111013677 isoform X2 [Momordica charantia]|uniref:Uncharacterized protein LOC111013677 isoform X2 n=1 Tax=Momordica charantia TaxID=3673 RepID=A0A6J1CS37_MOMCH|nr:uncharacterized protein LOC111013677 isoform X2 [Momordica charantia]